MISSESSDVVRQGVAEVYLRFPDAKGSLGCRSTQQAPHEKALSAENRSADLIDDAIRAAHLKHPGLVVAQRNPRIVWRRTGIL